MINIVIVRDRLLINMVIVRDKLLIKIVIVRNRRRSCLRSFFLRHSTNKAHTGGANHSTASM